MKRTGLFFILPMAFVVMLILFIRACNAPILFQTTDGQVCGCLVDQPTPTLSQCKKIDYDSLYETIYVSHCN